ncbi:MAG: DEAD/DEAH box helicase [Spirochaetia bacterium]|nr:DEAD/DEAH box helicase [Spirochaetia bacterium]
MENNNEKLFTDYPLSESVLEALEAKGFRTLTPVQEKIIPLLLAEDKNVAVKARTGTGKTAAFGIPLVHKIAERTDIPQALILAPTRELALQISQEISSFTNSRYPRITAVYGGASMGLQLRALERGSEIVVGTPGRVQDHIDRGSLDLSQIKYLILDEADEMLDMGFIDDVRAIIDHANSEKKVALFSATMPAPIVRIINEQLGETEVIEEDAPEKEEILTEQEAMILQADDRYEALKRIIDSTEDFHGLVFCPTKIEADEISRKLTEDGYPAEALHGNLSQEARERTLRRFRNKITTILIATDVAARGIDVERLTHVINWDLPRDFDSYVHRIGRTGRAGEKGIAVSFIRPSIRYKLRDFTRKSQTALGSTIRTVKVPAIDSILEIRCDRLEKALANATQEQTPQDEAVEAFADKLIAQLGAKDAVKAMLHTAYGTIFDTDRYKSIKQFEEKQEKAQRRSKNREGQTVRIHLNCGREDGIGPKDIVKLLEKLVKISGNVIDDISVKGTFSFATVPVKAGMDAVEKSKKDKKLPTITLAKNDRSDTWKDTASHENTGEDEHNDLEDRKERKTRGRSDRGRERDRDRDRERHQPNRAERRSMKFGSRKEKEKDKEKPEERHWYDDYSGKKSKKKK